MGGELAEAAYVFTKPGESTDEDVGAQVQEMVSLLGAQTASGGPVVPSCSSRRRRASGRLVWIWSASSTRWSPSEVSPGSSFELLGKAEAR